VQLFLEAKNVLNRYPNNRRAHWNKNYFSFFEKEKRWKGSEKQGKIKSFGQKVGAFPLKQKLGGSVD